MDDIMAILGIIVSLGVLALIAYILSREKKGMAIYYRLGNKYCMLENNRACTDGDCRKCVFAYVAYDYEKQKIMQQKKE